VAKLYDQPDRPEGEYAIAPNVFPDEHAQAATVHAAGTGTGVGGSEDMAAAWLNVKVRFSIEIAPVRGALVVFASTPNANVPLPLPVPVPRTCSQGVPLTALQAHPAPAVTAISKDPPFGYPTNDDADRL
jgi:hypothetical protein